MMTTKERIANVHCIADEAARQSRYYAPWLRQDDAELAKRLDALGAAAAAVADYIAARRQ